jgi:hypothetical protein
MSTPPSENNPKPKPPEEPRCFTESRNAIYVYVDGPGDTTIRPRRPNIPIFWPEGVPFPWEKQPDQRSKDQPPLAEGAENSSPEPKDGDGPDKPRKQ